MSKVDLSQFGLDRAESGDDNIVPFALEEMDCRGREVSLSAALDQILTRHDYPEPVARLLGEAILLAALVGAGLKFEGKFILQTQSDGPIDMMVVDFASPSALRGYARFDRAEINKAIAAKKTTTADLLGEGHLAMTIDQGRHMERYQGIVKLDGISLEEAARHYFMQSEQIPTQVRLAVGQLTKKGAPKNVWRARGLMLQHFPAASERNMPDLPGDGDFDNVETNDNTFAESENWREAKSLFETVSDAELLDPDLSSERLLFRLYHEKGVRVFEPQMVEDRCSCSAERIELMLAESFSAEDRAGMVEDGEIEVKCEFCSTAYAFNPNMFDIGE